MVGTREAIDEARGGGFAPIFVAGESKDDVSLLAASDIGIAVVSRSSEEAIQAADVIIAEDDPALVDYAVDLIVRTSRVVNESRWASRLVGAMGFTAAAFGKLSAANAARLHNYTRLAAELNSLRLA